jgi:RNA polymerase sigma-70 factor (ECF subfamily)
MMVVSHPPLDLGLIHDARGGNAEARDRLVRDVYHRVFRYFLRLTRGREDAALDGAQETMLRILRALPELRDPQRFIPWALRIATNVWRDRLRGRQDVERAVEAVVVEEPGRRLNVNDMLGRVDRLPEPYRSALTLRYLEGLSYEAMSEVLDLSSGTLRSHVARGLRMLREEMES